MTEDELERRDSRNGAPVLECLVIALALLECSEGQVAVDQAIIEIERREVGSEHGD